MPWEAGPGCLGATVPGRTAFIYLIWFKKTLVESSEAPAPWTPNNIYDNSFFFYCWLGLHSFALNRTSSVGLNWYTFFLPGKERSLSEIVNSMEFLRLFCLSKAQLCLRSIWLPHCPFVTYSWHCFQSQPLCAGAASGSAFLWSRLQCACCVCCRSVVLSGAYADAINWSFFQL